MVDMGGEIRINKIIAVKKLDVLKNLAVQGAAYVKEEEIEEDFENSDTPWKCLEGKVKWVGRNES